MHPLRESCTRGVTPIRDTIGPEGPTGFARKSKGTTVKELNVLTKRRNRIAHERDRRGHGRARIRQDEPQRYVAIAKDVAEAVERVLGSAQRESTTV
jgi:hypothetical protein